jgi:glutamate formiminotransferase/glutamate formiminotransferase/formiminotetrahydrofolate cyclodeaminase
VLTLAGAQGSLSGALLAGARVAVERIDVGQDRNVDDIGVHPHVGALDVMPLVYLDASQRGAACAEALVVGSELGEDLGVPVFLYGELAQGRTRAELRRGGMAGLAQRLSTGELCPDFGPPRMHPSAGATLVAAREPLVAFNLELSPPASVQDAKRIASLVREGGAEGLPGLRALGVSLSRGGMESKSPTPPARAKEMRSAEVIVQLSMNVERPLELPLRAIVEAVRRHVDIACAELVGLAPRAAFEGFPEDVPLPGFDPGAHVIENALGF